MGDRFGGAEGLFGRFDLVGDGQEHLDDLLA